MCSVTSEQTQSSSSSTDEPTQGKKNVFKEWKASATAVSWFGSDTAHFCVSLYNICGKASAHLCGEEHNF